jgi:hypothetical protein
METTHPKRAVVAGWCALALTLVIAFAFMVNAARSDSAVMDELAHIPAGYGYVEHFDYRLNPEHPPLVKVLAGLPLHFLHPNFPTDSTAWTTDVNGQWDMGRAFLYESGNDAQTILGWARVGPMLLTLLLVILIYAWSAELLGPLWGLVPALLFGLSPSVLAHGHYVTTDVAAAFGIVLATRYFLKYLKEPSRESLFVAGIAFGVAQLAKFSAVLLVPYFMLLLAIFALLRGEPSITTNRLQRLFRGVLRYLRTLVVVFAVGYVVIVYPTYFLFTRGYPAEKQLSDATSILTSFGGGPTPAGAICKPIRCLADLDIAMVKSPITRPLAQYYLGVLMTLQRSIGGNTDYFMGQVSAAGWTSYFPTVYAVKEPLPTLAIVLVGLLLGLWGLLRTLSRRAASLSHFFRTYLVEHPARFAMLLFVIIYWAWSMKSPLNIGFRHLFPTLPFIYILAAGAWKRWITTVRLGEVAGFLQTFWAWVKRFFAAWLKLLLLAVLLVWFFFETVAAAPYFLSYFNQLGGGTANGYRYVTDSNYDWGQDLVRLKQWVDARNNDDDRDNDIDRIAVDYFGGGKPAYYLAGKEVDWWSARGNPLQAQTNADNTQTVAENGPRESAPGQRTSAIRWLAVSVNTLEGATQPTVAGQVRKPEDEYRWLTALRPPIPGMGNLPKPDYRVGTSIFIYKL